MTTLDAISFEIVRLVWGLRETTGKINSLISAIVIVLMLSSAGRDHLHLMGVPYEAEVWYLVFSLMTK